MRTGLIVLAVLNLIDALATSYGLRTQHITELNPLMNGLYEIHPLLFLSFKVFLSIILLSMLKITFPVSKLLKTLTIAAGVLYGTVCTVHMYWLLTTVN